jgi:hypothetical protein
MPYVNELVPESDIVKHGLKALCERYARVDIGIQWTVDRMLDSFLMEMRRNPQDPHMKEFVFFWEGHLEAVVLRLETVSSDQWTRHLRWHQMLPPRQNESPELALSNQSRLSALKDALSVYRTQGLYSGHKKRCVIDFSF